MALYLVNLWERRKDLVLNFSGGMKRRLEIARSIVHEPGLLFLDEPTIGLDPQTRRQIWDYVLTLNKEQGLTVLLTTHYLEEAEICHKIAVIDHGQIVALDSPGNLKKNLGGDIITLRTCDNQSIQKIIQAEFKIEVSILANELRLQVTDGTAFLTRLFHTFGKAIITVDIKKPALEDVFIHLTGKEIREQEGSTIDKVKNTVKSRWLR
jgi:ABC-2 type transport system ATP-binding protein